MSSRVLVTGCASGIGRQLAATLVQAGHRVVATDRELGPVREDAQEWPEDRVRVEALDVTDPRQWEAVVGAAEHAFGGVDVLVNVAGVLVAGWAHEIPESAVDLHVDVNLKGVVHGMRAVLPGMLARSQGHIINVASLAALAPVPGLALYSATKYAVRGYSLSVALELESRGVSVTVVCPDAVQTPMLDAQRHVDAAAMTFSGSRVLTVQEVADAIVQAMDDRPLEVLLPPSRGWLAKIADVAPVSGQILAPLLRWQGRRKQRS